MFLFFYTFAGSRAHDVSEESQEVQCWKIHEITQGRARSCFKGKYEALELYWKWRKETQDTANETFKASVQGKLHNVFISI